MNNWTYQNKYSIRPWIDTNDDWCSVRGQRGHSYQLVCYNFSSIRRCFVIRMLYDSLWASAL